MKILLSIKPVFASQIFEGNKKFEYRRTIFKNPKVESVVVYASNPVKRIVGEFKIKKVLFDDIDTLWLKTKFYSGITEEYFFQYFANKDCGYAINVGETEKYKIPKFLDDVYGIRPPQSFAYLI